MTNGFNNHKQRVLVTGSKGFVGRRLLMLLEQSGYAVAAADLRQGVDVTNLEHLQTLTPFDAAVHLAAKVFVPAAYRHPRNFYHANVVGTLNLLELCRLNEAKFIFASSYVYGSPRYLPIDENHPVQSANPYSESKIIGERLCARYHSDFGLRVVILRPFNVFGPAQNDAFLIANIFKQLEENGSVRLKDPTPRRDFVYVDDVAEAFLAAIRFEDSPFEIINIGSGTSFSVQEIAEEVIHQAGAPDAALTFSHEQRHAEIQDCLADISKAKKMLKWHPRTDIRDGISACLRHGRKHVPAAR
jgi:nucleoside-diphosphate-sugar epimerase